MTNLTTVKVSVATRNELKTIAERDGITLDAALQKLLRYERQRQMGADLAERPIADVDSLWVAATTTAVSRALG
jgi:hypothetical protein